MIGLNRIEFDWVCHVTVNEYINQNNIDDSNDHYYY